MNLPVSSTHKHRVVIIGAGTGGISVAARLKRALPDLDLAIVDPATHHDYQPAWTLVGGGAYQAKDSRRALHTCLPTGVVHVPCAVVALLPDQKQIALENGICLTYDFLVIAAGIQNHWDAIDGLEEALGKNGVTSNYRYDLAPYTWDVIRHFHGGNALFTQPAGAIKCPGAPQKAVYLAADHFRKTGVPAHVEFHTAATTLFGVPFYAQALEKVMDTYGTKVRLGSTLIQVRGSQKVAVFESTVNGRLVQQEVPYEMLHVVPPQSAPDFICESTLADANGWLDVDKYTLRHTRYPDIFGLGDCTSTPNSKTAAAIKSQAPVLVGNLLHALLGRGNTEFYDGYSACPLTTSNDKVLLAEFTYGGVTTPSFSHDPRVPRRFYWWLKRHFMPFLYWNIILKGRNWPTTHKARDFPAQVPFIQP